MKTHSPAVQQEIWGHLLDVARMHRFVMALEHRCNRLVLLMRYMTYLASSGIVGTLIAKVEVPAAESLALLITAIVILNHVLKPGPRALKLHYIRVGLQRVETRYRHLWEEVNRAGSEITIEEAREASISLIEERDRHIESITIKDEKLNKKCARETYAVEAQRYT